MLVCISQWQRRKYCLQIQKRLWELKLIAIKSKTIFYSIDLYENFATQGTKRQKGVWEQKGK